MKTQSLMMVCLAGAALALPFAGWARGAECDTLGLRGSIFLGVPGNDVALDLDDASYAISLTRVFTGDKPGTVLALSEDPAHNVIATGQISGHGMFPGFTPPDNFVAAFCGCFIPAETGTHQFRWDCDDRGMMYIDLNHNGVFTDNEGLTPDPVWEGDGTVSLVAGQVYRFIFMAQEYAGGETINFWFTPPGSAEARVDPTLQAGMWMTQVPEPATLSLLGLGAGAGLIRRRKRGQRP